MNPNEIREKRASIWSQMEALMERGQAEGRTLSAEEAEQYDRLEGELNGLTAELERSERYEAQRAALNAPIEDPINLRQQERERRDQRVSPVSTPEYRDAFRNYLRYGLSDMDASERQILRFGFQPDEDRAAQTVTTSGGGYLVPTEFQNEIIRAMLAYGGVRANARVIDTSSGATLLVPTLDDTSNTGRLLGINAAITNVAFAVGQKQLDAYKYSSDSILVPWELMQDSAFNVDALVRSILAERLGRITEQHYTTGSGSGQPNGVVTAATAGKTGATGQTTSVTADDLMDLFHAIDPAYRLGASWMMHDSTVKALRKLKTGVSGDNTYLWQPGLANGEPDRLLGQPVIVNQQMDAMAAGKKSILFGNFQNYWIRDTGGIRMLRLNERYSDNDQIGFVAFLRTDGELIGPDGTIKYYINAAS